MEKQAFTPGRWVVNQKYADGCFGGSIDDANGKTIAAILPTQKRDPAERKANASLISAAPELYEALIACSRELHLICNRKLTAGEEHALALTGAALSKAQGGAA